MDLKSLVTDDEAVSPVIGVILMVAITVILAAVIGTFVLGLGDQVQSTSPQASFNFDYTQDAVGTDAAEMNDTLVITHDGGDSIAADRLNVTVSNAVDKGDTVADFSDDAFSSEASAGSAYNLTYSSFDAGSSAASGDKKDFSFDSDGDAEPLGLDMSGSTVRVVWSDENGGSSATLGKWSGPDA
jgi:flagellin-like protein